MEYLSLDGSWTLSSVDGAHADIPAVVPGCVHTDLLRAELIEDPYYRDNELSQMWVGERDWTFRRTFRVSGSFLANERVELVCEGLDTLARIVVNGSVIGTTDNAFRTWRFDVGDRLHVGENTIEVTFASPVRAGAEKNQERFYWHTGIGAERLEGVNHLRKSQCNFGWDWGPRCATSGIWKPIRLSGISGGRFDHVSVRQEALSADAAALSVAVRCKHTDAPATLRVHVRLGEDDVAVGTAALPLDESGASAELSLHIAEPRLWWPNGAGDQPLYAVVCELLNEQGERIDEIIKTVGLRTVRLVREADDWGESFYFEVNGRAIFAKGANWIPADTFVTRIGTEHYEALLSAAAQANMNMLRVWGGGIYEEDLFYELCDRLGLLVWHDFMFACAAYPADQEAFLESVKAEAIEQVRRISHHPCMALWCGNNELEQIHGCIADGDAARAAGAMDWKDYELLFDEVLAGVVNEHAPWIAYWPSSPHTPGAKRADSNDPNAGDAHLWMVWHGRQPFEAYFECEHRFNSEFGFQSFPEPRAVARYAAPGERNITSRIMEHHQRSPIGNDAIVQYMLEWFQLPAHADMVLWTSQILQGLAITYAVEHWRRSAPRGMGTLYWQLNDCWPVASWSSLDWQGRWKALHYMMKRAYAPLLLSTVVDSEGGHITLYVTSDEAAPCETVLSWRMWTTSGEIIALGEEDVDVPAAGTVEVLTLEFDEQIEQLGAHNLILFGELHRGVERESDVVATFVRPKHLDLESPLLHVERSATPESHSGAAPEVASRAEQWTITAEKPALWVWPDLPDVELRYSDRFFHVEPDRPRTITVTPARLPGEHDGPVESGVNVDWRRVPAKVYSLFDTFQA